MGSSFFGPGTGFRGYRLAVAAIAAALVLPSAIAQQAPQQAQPPAQPTAPPVPPAHPATPPPDPHAAQERRAERQALGFLQYLDQGRYADSYAYTAALLRAKVNRDQFAKELRKVRAGKGAEQSSQLLRASYTTTLPDVPPGQYVILQYMTNFVHQKNAVETLTLAYERQYWRIAGYFLK